MKLSNDRITMAQCFAITFVSVLSPLLRRTPGDVTAPAREAAWLSPIFVLLPVLLLSMIVNRLRPTRDIRLVLCDTFGKVAGRALLVFFALWYILCAAFILRSAADRFTLTIYPATATWIFIVALLAICIPASLGSLKAIARFSMIMQAVLSFFLILICVIGLKSVDLSKIMPVSPDDILPAARGSLTIINILGVGTLIYFIEGQSEGKSTTFSRFLRTIPLILIIAAMCLICLSTFGAEMTTKMNFPFFIISRNLTFFRLVERVEAFFVAIWLFPDFVFVSLSLFIAQRNLKFCVGADDAASIKNPATRIIALICVTLALASALLLAQTSFSLNAFDLKIMSPLNLIISVFLLPLLLFIAKLRKKL